jgi:hypothetical protein
LRAAITGVIGLAAHRKLGSRKPWILTIAFALIAGMFVAPASANAAPNFDWACNSASVRSGTGHFAESNEQVWPCDDDAVSLASANLGSVQVTELQGFTSGDYVTAYASAGTVFIRVGHTRIAVGAVTASAQGTCFDGPGVNVASKVAGLRINGGFARVFTRYAKINVGGVVTLELNKTTTQYSEGGVYVTRQALVISFGFSPGQIIVGEASVGYFGDPCNNG